MLAIGVPVAIFLVWWGSRGGHGEVLSSEVEEGVIIERADRTCLVRAAGGETTRLICPSAFRSGMTVRLKRTRYENGELRFSLASATP